MATQGYVHSNGMQGEHVSCSLHFIANGAIGTYVPADVIGVSTADSGTVITWPENTKDMLFDAGPPTGVVELRVNGQFAGVVFDCAANQVANSNAARRLSVAIRKGAQVAFRVVGTLPA